MQIIIIKVPDGFQRAMLERVVTSVINAKNGQIIVAPHNYTFETMEVEGDGKDLVAVTQEGKAIKIIHDPRENLPEKAPYKH